MRANPLRRVAVLGCALATLCRTAPALANDAPTYADRSADELDDFDRHAVVMLDPLAIAQGVFGIEADLALNSHMAVALQGDLCRPGTDTEIAMGVGLLIYPFTAAFHGMYVEPRAAYLHTLTGGFLGQDTRADVALASVVAGWQWTWDYGFALRLGAGAAIYSNPSSSPFASGWASSGRVGAVTDTSLGWAW